MSMAATSKRTYQLTETVWSLINWLIQNIKPKPQLQNITCKAIESLQNSHATKCKLSSF